MTSKKCAACGAEIPAESKFCSICGMQCGSFCASCGAKIEDPTAVFCAVCGKSLTPAAAGPEPTNTAKEGVSKVEPQPANNIYGWLIAFMPIIGNIISLVIASASTGSENTLVLVTYAKNLWYVTLILNILLCTLDFNMLKKAGYDISSHVWAIFFIPVYLYIRGRITGSGYAMAFTWIICFCLSLAL